MASSFTTNITLILFLASKNFDPMKTDLSGSYTLVWEVNGQAWLNNLWISATSITLFDYHPNLLKNLELMSMKCSKILIQFNIKTTH